MAGVTIGLLSKTSIAGDELINQTPSSDRPSVWCRAKITADRAAEFESHFVNGGRPLGSDDSIVGRIPTSASFSGHYNPHHYHKLSCFLVRAAGRYPVLAYLGGRYGEHHARPRLCHSPAATF